MFTPKSPNIQSFDDLNEYLLDLERRIEEAFKVGEFQSINLDPLSVAPDKPRAGDLINADGTNYNPGSGAGIYLYTTTYTKV